MFNVIAQRLRPALRPSIAPTVWADPSGVRRLLRHHLVPTTAAIVFLILLGASLLGPGNSRLFAVLCGLVAAQVAFEIAFALARRPIPADRGFRLVLVTWPIGLALLGAAGWDAASRDYHGEVVGLIALITAGLVALVEPFWFAVGWGAMSAAALMIGAALVGPVTAETLVASAAAAVGVIFGTQLREILEAFLGSRRHVLQEVSRVPGGGDPFQTAAALLQPLVRWTPLRTASLVWFTDDGRAVFLAVQGQELPAYVATGRALPDGRGALLRRQAANGPWVTGWAVRDDDDGYTRGIAAAGITTAAYVPLMFEGRLIGLLTAGLGDAAGGHATLSEHFPILVEMGDVAGTALGPGIAAMEQRSTAGVLVDEVLRTSRFWPVFQPIRELTSDRIVGFEALTRFADPITPHRLFAQAALVGRLRGLEVATMASAMQAAAGLPGDSWLSVNSSPDLLADTDALGGILRHARRPIVLELSEHEIITDYSPIAVALARLGPDRRLAVDDAGAGFASLRHILEVRPDYVKLDLGLVQGVASDVPRRALVAGFVHFARDAGFTLIAEGIETQDDLGMLRSLGVPLGQGYLLGRPERLTDVREVTAIAH